MREFHRPARFDQSALDRFLGGSDPATHSHVAHQTAQLLVSRARGDAADENLVKRMLHYTDEHGLETIGELWALAPAGSLPGVLWRVYVLRAFIMQRSADVGYLFQLGCDRLGTVDPAVAGVESPVGPEAVRTVSERILRGVFQGDLASALYRAASFCRLVAAGCLSRADATEAFAEREAQGLVSMAGELTDMSEAFRRGAVLWTENALD